MNWVRAMVVSALGWTMACSSDSGLGDDGGSKGGGTGGATATGGAGATLNGGTAGAGAVGGAGVMGGAAGAPALGGTSGSAGSAASGASGVGGNSGGAAGRAGSSSGGSGNGAGNGSNANWRCQSYENLCSCDTLGEADGSTAACDASWTCCLHLWNASGDRCICDMNDSERCDEIGNDPMLENTERVAGCPLTD